MGEEIANHTWILPPHKLALALGSTVDRDHNALQTAYRLLIQSTKAVVWPSSDDEQSHYPPLAQYLNNCIDACREASDALPSGRHGGLDFIVWAKPMKDDIGGTYPVKPDLAGGLKLQEDMDRPLYWSPLTNDDKQLLLPVEVKYSWPQLVRQAATYGRCLFSAEPLGSFALGVGFNQHEKMLRFLVLHRGGLTASPSLLVRVENKEDTLNILFLIRTILNWETSSEAGLTPWWNNVSLYLPRDKEDTDGMVFTVDRRGTCVSRISYKPSSAATELSKQASLYPQTEVRRSPRLVVRQERPPDQTQSQTRTRSQTRMQSQRTPSQRPSPRLPSILSVIADEDANKQKERPITITSEREPRGIKFVAYDLIYSSGFNPDVSIKAILKTSWVLDEYGSIEAEALRECSGEFGCQMHHFSFQPLASSNRAFLPAQSDANEQHWNVFGPSCPSKPEARNLMAHVCAHEGESLVKAKDSWELFLSIGHAMLGWLTSLQNGFMHRDISIGNVFLLPEPVTTKPFKLKTEMLQDSYSPPSVAGTDSIIDVEPPTPASTQSVEATTSSSVPNEQIKASQFLDKKITSEEQSKHIERLLTKLNISDQCRGITTDYDMAMKVKTYFQSERRESRSGTPEFMSDTLLESVAFREPYLQSPIDDLWSFYFVGQWGTVHHKTKEFLDPRFRELRQSIAGTQAERKAGMYDLGDLDSDSKSYGSLLPQCLDFLRRWLTSVRNLQSEWKGAQKRANAFLETHVGKDAEVFVPLFYYFGLKGVADYLELLDECMHTLAGSPSYMQK